MEDFTTLSRKRWGNESHCHEFSGLLCRRENMIYEQFSAIKISGHTKPKRPFIDNTNCVFDIVNFGVIPYDSNIKLLLCRYKYIYSYFH